MDATHRCVAVGQACPILLGQNIVQMFVVHCFLVLGSFV